MRAMLLAGAVVVVSTAPAAADDPLGENAALQYWQTLAMLPRDTEIPDEQSKRLEEWATCPFDDTTDAVLKRYENALIYLHRGAVMTRCVWASAANGPRDGVGTMVPQVWMSYRLRPVVLLRARVRFAQGQPDRAVGDLVALMRFARSIETGSGLLGDLQSATIERDVYRVLGDNLWAILANRKTFADTRAKWDALPPARSLTAVLTDEKDGLVGMFRHHARLNADDPRDDETGPIGFIPTLKFIAGLETKEQAVETVCGTLDRHYTRFIRATDVPPDKILAAEKQYLDSWPRTSLFDDPIASAVTRMLLPAAGKLRLTEAEMKTRRVMLRAAMAVADKGAGELDKHPDPFTAKPFQLKRFEGGFELASPAG
jgi:hypothetical protein